MTTTVEASADPKRGTGLAIAGQATFIGATLFGVLGAITSSSIGFLGALGALTGLVLTIIAFFLMRAPHGRLWQAAAWVIVGGVAAALLLFLAWPSEREWGKLAAMVFSLGALSLTLAVGQLVAGAALMTGGTRGLGLAVVLLEAALIACGALAVFADVEAAGFIALALTLAGHACLMIGIARLRSG